MLSPIVLFVYNRPWHTQQTIEALQKNDLALQSDLIIYSDAPKNKSDKNVVEDVRRYIKGIEGFKTVSIVEREKNLGLANSIIDGVEKIVNKYGRVIVLEDDIITSPYFLKFMNEALEFYKDQERVWHVSGWNCPINTDGLEDVFLWRFMDCWGWATWANRWQHFEKNVDKTIKEFNKQYIRRFNLEGVENFFGQVIANKEKKINTWAIFWYATIFKNNGLCLNPTQTFVENIGHDGSGVHCGKSEAFVSNLSVNKSIKFTDKADENQIALERIQVFYKSQKKPFLVKVINKLSRVFSGKNIFK